ncbi:MAG: division plane positioning ATPase MipZ [Rhodospirillales bacterium]|nr:division plane positioning ATPase MipZ [Rhodospirillales bacterium]
MKDKKAHIITISNEKGGTGKSTVSMHLAIFLMQEGFKVAVVDMDGRQGTLSRYVENRKKFAIQNHINLIIPQLVTVTPRENHAEYDNHISEIELAMNELAGQYDAIIIDTPGGKNYLFEEAHKLADTLITPISDSLIDLNVLSEIDKDNPEKHHAGHYAQFVWDMRKYRAQHGKQLLNWIVVGNKISPLNSKNKTFFFEQLNNISKLYGFRVADGIKDRVIYKELFLQGLTVLDVKSEALKGRLTMSHLAAKQEIRALAEYICPQG